MKSIVLVLAAVIVGANGCLFPPSLWCDSTEIAQQCKVYNQCKDFVWREDLQAPPVNFELYFESLCPDCQQFITRQLYPVYTKIGSIMNLTLVPFGNAEERKHGSKWIFHCQHGKEECIGNLLETCTIHALNGDMTKVMPFIYCMESSHRDPMMAFRLCARKQGVPEERVLNCYNSSEGNQLEHQMALRTNALKPPHQYVPWVVLNGVHTEKINEQAVENLLKLICDTYTGPKPSGCSQPEKQKASVRSGV